MYVGIKTHEVERVKRLGISVHSWEPLSSIVNPFTNDNVCEKYYGNVIWDLLVCRLYSFLCICGKHMTFRVCRAHHPVRATLHVVNTTKFFGHTLESPYRTTIPIVRHQPATKKQR